MKNIKLFEDFINESGQSTPIKPDPKMALTNFKIGAPKSGKIDYLKMNSDFKKSLLNVPKISMDPIIKSQIVKFKPDDPDFISKASDLLANKGIEIYVDDWQDETGNSKYLGASVYIPNTNFSFDFSRGYAGLTFSKEL
jgi:hypothetical protein